MKKLFMMVSALVLCLSACSSNEKPPESDKEVEASNNVSKTCSVSSDQFSINFKLGGKDGKLTSFKIAYTFPESAIGVKISELTADQKTLLQKTMGEELASGLGLAKDDYSYEYSDDALTISTDIEVDKMSTQVKSEMGINATNDFDATVKSLESDGATCK